MKISKLILPLILLSITPLISQTMPEEEISPKKEVSSGIKVINTELSQNNPKGNSLPSTSKGVIHLDVDVADDAGIDTISELITLSHIKASEIEPFIKARLSRYGTVQVNDALNMLIITDKEQKVIDLTKLVKGLDVAGIKDFLRLETEVISLKYALASLLAPTIKSKLSSDGTIQGDDNLNVLIITDVRSKIDYAKKIIELLDIPTIQVLIEAKIIEASDEVRKELGIDWWALSDLFPRGSIDYAKDEQKQKQISPSPYEYKSEYSRINGRAEMDLTKLGDFINLLIKDGKAKLLANPKIMTLNNTSGRIEVGERIGYEVSSSYFRSYSQEQIGLILQIIPHIGASKHINLNVSANMRSLSGWNSNGSPIISEQNVSNSILVEDGGTFLVGGLKKKDIVKVIKRVPILGHILPYLFSKKEDTIRENDLIILITPHIIKTPTPIEKEELKKLEEQEKGKK